MALINHAKREINAKIVYYGHEGVGKRVSLQYLYDRIKPALRGELKTVPASGDSLVFFDFSPFEQPVFGGYRIRFHLYSLTGKVTNPAAWKMTLKGADGLVIVADASPEMIPASRESISNLREFLAAYGVGLHDTPCVLQLNGAVADGRAGIAAALDVPDMRICHSETGSGKGVLEGLSMLSRDIMARIEQDPALRVVEYTSVPGVGPSDASPALMPLAQEEHLTEPDEGPTVAEVSPLSGKPLEESQNIFEGPRVTLAGERAICDEGAIRIPLEITFDGVSRRLVVSIAIEAE